MTPDVVWSLPGHSRISDEARGIEAVIERSQIIVSGGLCCWGTRVWLFLSITRRSVMARFSTNTWNA
jgi:hypothetical protein